MTVKTMLTVQETNEPLERLDPIIELARSFDAHLNVVVLGLIVAIPATVYGLGMDVAWKERPEEVHADVSARIDAIERKLSDAGVSATVIAEFPEVGSLDRTVRRHALLADLTVVPHGVVLHDATANDIFEGAVHDTGRAILVLGRDGPDTLPTDRAVVAWDGTPEAAKAVRECLPFLKPRAHIRIVTVDPKVHQTGPNPGNDIAGYLARHGHEVEIERVPSDGRRPGELILENVLDTDARLIVMGIFAHPRVRQWFLGSATHDVMAKTEAAVLGAH